MKGIRMENGVIIYYGSAAGYVSGEKAIVDSMFASEALEDFLKREPAIQKVDWKEGVFEKLMNGQRQNEEIQVLRSCRVWQMKAESDIMMRFIGYEELKARFGEPDPKDYQVVYDGEVESNDLEVLYAKFNVDLPPDYAGHSLSMSDVVELYDEIGSEFYYCDRIGFQAIAFEESDQSLQMKL